jgi:hypothetical protein
MAGVSSVTVGNASLTSGPPTAKRTVTIQQKTLESSGVLPRSRGSYCTRAAADVEALGTGVAKVGELVLLVIARSGPVGAWTIDEMGFSKKRQHSALHLLEDLDPHDENNPRLLRQ